MPQNTHLETSLAEKEQLIEAERKAASQQTLSLRAEGLARTLVWLPNTPSSLVYSGRAKAARAALKPLLGALPKIAARVPAADDVRWLSDHVRLIHGESVGATESSRRVTRIPHVRDAKGEVLPRVLALAEGYLETTSYQFNDTGFLAFFEKFQETTLLNLDELSALVPSLKLVLLEQVVERSRALMREPDAPSRDLASCIRSLVLIGQASWKELLEPLIVFDRILRQDPVECYAQMDFNSRDYYRTQLAKIAAHSEKDEMGVAKAALALAQKARLQTHPDPRVVERESHIGYYLVSDGLSQLRERIGYHFSFPPSIQWWMRTHADEFFLPGIEILTFLILSITALLLTPPSLAPGMLLFSILVLLLPCSQSAVQIVNLFVTTLLPATILPKFDFSEGVSDNCVTMVAVPSLLLNEKQVRALADDLEVRYLGNHDPNIHFALLTDLPDSREPAREDSPLIDLCAQLIEELNQRYAAEGAGSFFLFHRHRVYNPHERAWMGWERKRGKLLDLNQLLRGQFDSFPLKVGDLSVLQRVRFVITLDSDTELPRGAAHRMIGALAHPLNQAIIDPLKNIVTAGYGILQPRVGVSVQSTARSRMAAIYAGETGFDIYTRAVSDAYQDLYGEGIFTGKGIYEVATLHRVLNRRFPRNALLSHDLIEGAYARAGLLSDVEVIEDYPSHYSAYNRRKHRWLRGDWQIVEWLLPRVRNESGNEVANPISLISRWKIFDNLRRSLVEPATFVLFLVGWLLGGTPWHWTVATVCILWLPSWFELIFSLVRSVVKHDAAIARDAVGSLYSSTINVLLTITFLAHQTLVSLDAVVRTLVRRWVTRHRLLEWETAAEAETGVKGKTPVDMYLDWTPALALVVGLLAWFARPSAFPVALPILLLWLSSRFVAGWLNQPSVAPRNQISRDDALFLRRTALYTWRYFAEYSTEEHHWLIPDNVQEDPFVVAPRLSPTNLGLLLNARQVACEFGFLTVPDFAHLTLQTLDTVAKLSKRYGHLLNWYDTHTLQPLAPLFISSVDSGNLLASLWTLRQGTLERLRQPVVQPCLAEGLLDHLRVLADRRALPRKSLSACERERKTGNWLCALLSMPVAELERAQDVISSSKAPSDAWFAAQARVLLQNIENTVRSYAPWFLPEFESLREDHTLNLPVLDNLALDQLPRFLEKLEQRLGQILAASSFDRESPYVRLHDMLPTVRENVDGLVDDLRRVAFDAGELADQMDFSVLLDPHRKLLSVGYDSQSDELQAACYDLLATESRTAVFVAIAKDDIPQESWFLLGRAHTLDQGHPVLLSWTGTMFEYLMPALWMRSYPNTLLERSQAAVVVSQQAYALEKRVSWGISESAYHQFDDAGNYKYHAFGIPHVALRKPEFKALVISPYSTILALSVDPSGALANLRRMRDLGWFGACGFYEAADFTSGRRFLRSPRFQLVRCWMAHHQGMSLLSIANFLNENVVQGWFHADRRVQATELLLHEKPVAHVRSQDLAPGNAAA
jgi:cyclic beta-1,2-glucan synthetase